MKRIALFLVLLTVACLLVGCGNDGTAEKYEVHCTLGEECHVLGNGKLPFAAEGHVTIALLETQGPTEFDVSVLHNVPDKEISAFETAFHITLEKGHGVTLPAGAEFSVSATAVAGQNGYATFLVAIS